MSSNLQPEPAPTHVVVVVLLLFLIPVFCVLSLVNGVEPFACPPGSKTITSPTSLEKWCEEA